MKDHIKRIRKNRNDKYYDLLVTHFHIINKDSDQPIRLSVDAILRDQDVSRPTFYSYYTGVQEFYTDLMDVIVESWPQYMQELNLELNEQNFLKAAFSVKLGVTMNNMMKVSGKYPTLRDPWNAYFRQAVKNMGVWYSEKYNIPLPNGEKISRRVLNELILHDHLYYKDYERYKTLILKQITA